MAFDSGSGNAAMTVNVASACTSIIVSGTYAGTLTFNSTLTVGGTVTFLPGMTIAGTAGTLSVTTTATLQSGGKTLTCNMQFAGTSQIFTMAGGWIVNQNVLLSGVTAITINGSTLNVVGNLTVTTSTSGTCALTMSGTPFSIWSGAGTLKNSLTFTGNITVSGTVFYNTGTLTDISVGGTITAGSTLSIAASTTLNVVGTTWNNISITAAATITLSSLLQATGTLTLANAAITFSGAGGFTVGTLTNTSLTASRIYTLTFGATYIVTGSFTNVGTTAAIRQAFKSGTPGSKVVLRLNYGATQDLGYCDPTDIDSSSGQTVYSFRGTITTTLNWSAAIPQLTTVASAG